MKERIRVTLRELAHAGRVQRGRRGVRGRLTEEVSGAATVRVGTRGFAAKYGRLRCLGAACCAPTKKEKLGSLLPGFFPRSVKLSLSAGKDCLTPRPLPKATAPSRGCRHAVGNR